MTQPIEQLIDIYSPFWPGRSLSVPPGDLRLSRRPALPISSCRRAAPRRTTAMARAWPIRCGRAADRAGRRHVYIQGQPAPADLVVSCGCCASMRGARLCRLSRPRRRPARGTLPDTAASHYACRAGRHSTSTLARRDAPISDQRLTIGELVSAFVVDERQRWSTRPAQPPADDPGEPRVEQALAFGFMVENAHYGVYRIWSRVWLLPH